MISETPNTILIVINFIYIGESNGLFNHCTCPYIMSEKNFTPALTSSQFISVNQLYSL
jgi:hypothetical protein